MKRFFLPLLVLLPVSGFAAVKEVMIPKCHGVKLNHIISSETRKLQKNDTLKVILTGETYNFTPEKATKRELYISNHDQDNPKSIGLIIENCSNIIIEGNEAEFLFDGRMLPIAAVNVDNLTISGIQIDFPTPHIAQVEVLENKDGIITYRPAAWVNYEIRDGKFYNKGNGWEIQPAWGIPFEEKSRHVVYRQGDISLGTSDVTILPNGDIQAPWDNPALIPGTRIAMRGWGRPAPGIFIDRCKDVELTNVKIHYAEGMGLLAQNTENITLSGFGVCLRGDADPRYFTTQADATHFSSCWGKITSNGGLYENMMDDAINVHGTYLRISEVVDSTEVIAQYMHGQTYGFEWGKAGETIQLISPQTMEICSPEVSISSIEQLDPKQFRIKFDTPIAPKVGFGIENLTRTPEVEFCRNTIRNNRARGALFSTPRTTLCADNLFDHTSGSAILLCGDCNGWFETGACRDVTIRGNRFINALTSQYQFTNAVISIYPDIPNLKNQVKFFHSGISIIDNIFETFDVPLLYAKSVDGLLFLDNKIIRTTAYPPYHPQRAPISLEKVTNAKLQ